MLTSDLRHAFRLLWKSKRITATTLLTLALCIGATTAIFSTVYSLMLKPLPFRSRSGSSSSTTSAAKAGLNRMPANVPFYLDYSKNATSYESLGLWSFFHGLVGEKDSVVRIPGVRATAESSASCGCSRCIGTFFTKEQNKPGADKVIVLTQSYWQTQYRGEPDVLGKEVRIDEEAYKIIGVAPRVLEAFDARMKFIVPLTWHAGRRRTRRAATAWASSCSGASSRASPRARRTPRPRLWKSATSTRRRRRSKAFVERSGMTMNVGGVQEQRVQPVRATLLMLQGGVAFVLLIGCFNVANLLLVRSNARQSELADPIRPRGRSRHDRPAAPAGEPAADVARRRARPGGGLGRAAGRRISTWRRCCPSRCRRRSTGGCSDLPSALTLVDRPDDRR